MVYIRDAWRARALFEVEKWERLQQQLVQAWNRELSPLIGALRVEVNRLGGDPVTFTATGDVQQVDRTIYGDATDGAIDLTLPLAADVVDFHFFFKKTDSTLNSVWILPQSGEMIDGFTVYTLALQYAAIEMISDGTNYNIAFVYP